MQIACRNCKSIYEVNSSDIPISGREVQCYKCREIWFVRKISDRDFQNQYQRRSRVNFTIKVAIVSRSESLYVLKERGKKSK